MGFLFIPILGSIYLLSRDRLESESLAKSTAKSNNEPLKDNRPEISGGKIKFKNYEFSITKINDDEYQCEGRTYSKESLIRHVRQQVMKKVRQGEMGD